MVSLLLVNWRVDMLIQGFGCIKLAVADVAFPIVAVVGAVGHHVLQMFFVLPSDLLVGNQALAVRSLNDSEQRLAVQIGGVGARPCLNVVGGATGCHECSLTEGAIQTSATVNTRVSVLFMFISVIFFENSMKGKCHHA